MIGHITVLTRLLSFLFIMLSPAVSLGSEIPEQLTPWIPWVLHDQDDRLCTYSMDRDKRFCVWPAPLVMELNTTGGSFSQSWEMKREGWIVLPGKEKHWPKQVMINSEPALVVTKNGLPVIHVSEAGEFDVSGTFTWKNMPESLPIPAGSAIIDLTVEGRKKLADITGDTLWISSRSRAKEIKEEDTIHTQVYRHIKDSIPMLVTSRIEVQISGKPREITLDWQIPEDQTPVSLHCSLPVKIGSDARIHMQARPGKYTIIYQSRLQGPVETLGLQEFAVGPDREYWSFEAQNQLRMVKIGGEPVAVDPSQTTIPREYHSFPAYMVKKGQSLVFETLKRGNPEPPPNQLTMHRTLWMDSNGSGITIQDNFSGTAHQSLRLEMQSPAKVGRVVINGRDQLITRVKENNPAGVEVRQGTINGMAVSRIEETRSFPAGGWGQSLHKLSGQLILPPGWTVFHASGVDSVRTWISRWTLLDCFIVLIIVITTFKLLGIVKGATALIALLLSYHDPDAPVFIWLAILACIAIIEALPDSKYVHLVKRTKIALFIGLVIMVLPYSAEQLRIGFFPQLERVYKPYTPPIEIVADAVMEANEAPMPQAATRYPAKLMSKQKASPVSSNYRVQQKLEQQYDVQSKVQAGPGVPNKKWRVVPLGWNGPVEKDLQMSLVLLSPLINLLTALIKVAAIFALTFFMVKFRPAKKVRFELAAIPLVFALLSGPLVPVVHCAEYPSQKLLTELQTRLLEPATCFPHCADFEKMQIKLHGSEMILSIQAVAEAESAVRLPHGKGIYWQKIILNDTASPAYRDENQLWFALPKGRHTIELTGRINSTDLQLQLPLKPHSVIFDARGEEWSIAGLDENNRPDNQLQFIRKKEQQESADFGASTLPPFMQVERVLHLGLQWQVETIVTRLSKPGTSVFLTIPLLEGEAVTNGEYQVADGTISLRFGPKELQKRYHSIFTKKSMITLKAPNTTEWHEIWRLNASPVWHIEPDGLAPILHHSRGGDWQPEWRPWANEQLTLKITRPEGVPGPTKAIESSRLTITPGHRSTTMKLVFQIRSTRGDQQNVILPKDAVIQSVRINGREQPVKKDTIVVIPLTPASQNVSIEWRTPRGISTLFSVPEIDLGTESVNAEIEVQTGNRWVWFVKGPKMGPAILFYSELLIILLVSILLGRSQMTPLKSYHWLILGFGLSQSGLIPCLIIVAWFIALKIRFEKGELLTGGWFNLVQIMLVMLTIATIGALAFAVRNGLLGHPDMLIAGNDSSSYLLKWYQDRVINTTLPRPMVISIPMMAYRITMLVWALWMAFHLLKWVKWGWACFTQAHIWQATNLRLRRKSKGDNSKK